MAVVTTLNIVSEDHQGYQDTLQFRIAPLAFAAAQTLPTATEIAAVINAIYSDEDTPSSNRVVNYYVKVEETVPDLGGDGASATSSGVRVRNDIEGIPGNYMFRIPGMNKAALTFDPTNPNAVSTVGAMWDAIRAALAAAHIAISDPAGAYAATAEANIAEVATAVDGRRAPMRPR